MGGQIAVVLCTKDRPRSVADAVMSLLASHDDAVDVVVIDQSDDGETQTLLKSIHDDRLTYIRSLTRGKGAGLNEGFRVTDAPVIALTDDDCTFPPGWAVAMTAPFGDRERLGVVFSSVVAGEHDESSGYIPTFIIEEDRLLTSPYAVGRGCGMGASMAMRRSAFEAIGGADECYGPGSRFPSADDMDLELRALLRGWHVLETNRTAVVHLGFRSFSDGREHTIRDWYAMGGCIGKLVRAGELPALLVGLRIVVQRAVVPVIRELVRARRPPLRRLPSFVSGFWAAFKRPVDRDTLTLC